MSSPPPSTHERPTRRRPWAILTALAAILAVAFCLRAKDARHVFVDGRVLFPGYDTYYHMRRIQKTVEDWPHVPAYDAWVNHPWGARIYWPAGFDLALAAVAKLCGAQAWTRTVERICAWAIPVLGVGVVAATYWLGAVWRGRAVGLLAAAIVASLPAAIFPSVVGRVDHDVAIALLATAGFACCLGAWKLRSRWTRMTAGALAGLLLGLNLWVWPAAILFLLAAAAGFLAYGVVLAINHRPEECRWDVPCVMMIAAGLVVLVLCVLAPQSPRIASFAFLSALHGVLALSCALSTAIVAIMLPLRAPKRWQRLALVLAPQALVPLFAFGLLPELWGEFRRTLAFIGGKADVVVAQADEAQGLFAAGAVGVADLLTWAALAFPVALLLLVWRASGREGSAGDWLVVVWAAATGSLAVSQRRFAGFFAVPFALCVALLIQHLWALAGRHRSARAMRVALALACGISLLLPAQRWTSREAPSNWELRAILPALDWLRTQSAPAGDAHDFAAGPAHGVVAFWHYGHWLTYLAERANIACPFGNTPRHQQGLAAAQAVLGARSEAQAAARCRRLGIRYVLSTDLPLPLIAAEAGFDPRRPYAAPILAASLQRPAGPRAPDGAPLRHFRLRAQFPARAPWGMPLSTRVFEFVNDPRPIAPSGERSPLPR